ncbi:unnamed protein product [Callosobruchus maculatus]|uniref:Uncharacterized protein n=1 Tax=Callosobruchus maculatus TaxID=64391 RepID=A0A653DDZ5_CALMS|nr:unnamed protein product [Callosobruchus maculatus]
MNFKTINTVIESTKHQLVCKFTNNRIIKMKGAYILCLAIIAVCAHQSQAFRFQEIKCFTIECILSPKKKLFTWRDQLRATPIRLTYILAYCLRPQFAFFVLKLFYCFCEYYIKQ